MHFPFFTQGPELEVTSTSLDSSEGRLGAMPSLSSPAHPQHCLGEAVNTQAGCILTWLKLSLVWLLIPPKISHKGPPLAWSRRGGACCRQSCLHLPKRPDILHPTLPFLLRAHRRYRASSGPCLLTVGRSSVSRGTPCPGSILPEDCLA